MVKKYSFKGTRHPTLDGGNLAPPVYTLYPRSFCRLGIVSGARFPLSMLYATEAMFLKNAVLGYLRTHRSRFPLSTVYKNRLALS